MAFLVAGLGMPGGLRPRAGSAAPPLVMAACKLPDVKGDSQCGHLEVFEDRARGSGRTISIQGGTATCRIRVTPLRRRVRARRRSWTRCGRDRG